MVELAVSGFGAAVFAVVFEVAPVAPKVQYWQQRRLDLRLDCQVS
ncbi:hypothetical protein [Nostoc sp.]